MVKLCKHSLPSDISCSCLKVNFFPQIKSYFQQFLVSLQLQTWLNKNWYVCDEKYFSSSLKWITWPFSKDLLKHIMCSICKVQISLTSIGELCFEEIKLLRATETPKTCYWYWFDSKIWHRSFISSESKTC